MSAPTAPTDAESVPSSSSDRWVGRLWIGAGALLLIALGVAVVSGWLLSSRYRPMSPWQGITGEVDLSRPAPSAGVRTHEASLAVAVGVSLVWAALTIALVRSRGAGRIVAAVIAAVVTGASALVALVTWRLVAWDQAALWAVTVGSDVRGLWYPAFSDEVRFLLIDGAEVGQRTYAMSVLTHLAAPVVAVLSLGAGCAIARPARTRSVLQD